MAKALYLIYLILFFITSWYFPLKSYGQSKVALIVAVGSYPTDSGWDSLSSANDVIILKHALIKQGFEEKNIAVIQDKDATRQGILNAIKKHLTEKVKRGDIAVFHFSGHGQQVSDDNSDEIDGYDEALVPYDSPKHYEANIYEGEKLIRDEELGAWLGEVRRKLGKKGHLLTLIDACHSGSATRGLSRARGTHIRMASSAYLTAYPDKEGDANSLIEEAPDIKGLSPMVAFFSASPQQLSYEYVDEKGQGNGILSYSFSKTFGSAKEGTTYRSLFDQIRLQISSLSPRQTPQAEGFLDKELLGGNIIGAPKYFLPEERIDGRLLTIKSGTLAGLHDSTIVALFPIGTFDTTGVPPLALGTIAKASLLNCNVELDRFLPKKDQGCWIYIRKQNYGNLSAKLQLQVGSGSLQEALLSLPEDCPAIKLVDEDPEVVLQELIEEGKLLLLSKDGYALDTFSIPSSGRYKGLLRRIRKAIINFAQAKFLRPIEMENLLLNIDAQFLTLEGEVINLDERRGFQVGEEVMLRILNTGGEPFYFSLIDIRPDNIRSVIIPWKDEPASDYYLGAGEHYDYETIINITEPIGTEVLKLIATEEALDLSAVMETRNEAVGNLHPLELLYSETYLLDRKRGGNTSSVPMGEAAVKSVVFDIWK